MNKSIIKLFLRLSLAAAFLSALADRFGIWSKDISVWGNWDNFVAYTELINPWFPSSMIPIVASIATIAEIVFALCLILGFKTELIAKYSAYLLIIFGLSMSFATGVKGAFDYSVFTAAAAAFSVTLINEKKWELDNYLRNKF
jgi:uncharacterized membrane protein YphA (DoxX/SURF4 family)